MFDSELPSYLYIDCIVSLVTFPKDGIRASYLLHQNLLAFELRSQEGRQDGSGSASLVIPGPQIRNC